jgi:Tol biopolymer transport system component
VKKVASIREQGQEFNGFPVISLNGAWIAYATKLHVVRSDGSDHRVITERLAYESNYALSPDGARLAFFTDEPLGSQTLPGDLELARTDGTGSLTLMEEVKPDHDFRSSIQWSNDGTRILTTIEDAEGVPYIHAVHSDGSSVVKLGLGIYPTWSPDGRMIAWSGIPQDPSHRADIMYSVDMGVTIEYLTSTSEVETHPSFSSDGKKLLCTMWLDDAQESPGKLKVIDVGTKVSKILAEPIYLGYWIK